ncbi:MAG: DotA/TraY family protein, partial [Pseudomonadota bacterium]
KEAIIAAMNSYYKHWVEAGVNLDAETYTGSPVKDFAQFIFGVGGLGALRGNNALLHPMAQLTTLGKGLVDSAVFNVIGGFLSGIINPESSNVIGKLGDFLSSIAFIGLTAGVILFYILPLLPFIYFFFAVGSWVKTIFEAMVGIPLWALAHLRIDGEGLPGQTASNGYFLIFDIFARPIITVFGLIAATTIFGAQVKLLNFIWDMVVENVGPSSSGEEGYDVFNFVKKDEIDQFFYTIIYAVVCYMMATSSFKLIDEIPKNILRWMGAGVSAFSDINSDAADQLTRYAGVGGITFGRQATQAFGDAGKGLAKASKDELSKLTQTFGSGKG